LISSFISCTLFLISFIWLFVMFFEII
jgi:hypothetical protein